MRSRPSTRCPDSRCLAVPTLVVAGERDAATPLPAATALSNAIPDARITVLGGAPHMMQIESRDAFNAAIAAFLGERRSGDVY